MAADKGPAAPPPAAPGQTVRQGAASGPLNVICAGCRIDGNLKFAGSLRLGGEVLGDVSCDGTLTLEPAARIRGRVRASEIIVMGAIVGEIVASRRIEVGAGGIIEGSIFAPSMRVEGNARVDGDLLIAPERSTGHTERAKILAVLKPAPPPAPRLPAPTTATQTG